MRGHCASFAQAEHDSAHIAAMHGWQLGLEVEMSAAAAQVDASELFGAFASSAGPESPPTAGLPPAPTATVHPASSCGTQSPSSAGCFVVCDEHARSVAVRTS